MPGESEPRRPEAAARLALAFARGETIKKAAERLAVPYRTALRWSKTDRFKVAVEGHRRRLTERTMGLLVASTTRAVAAIVELMNTSQNEQIKLAAARTLLDKAPEWSDFAKYGAAVEELEALAERQGAGRDAY